MNNQDFFTKIGTSDQEFLGSSKEDFSLPEYDPSTHYLEIANSKYYRTLVILRNCIKQSCDFYWNDIQKAYNVDLFMMTPSVSSPIGPGSDSEAVEIKFGNLHTYLVDSSQFGFEPILLNGIDKVYCYLPSMRGENPDKRHLNQFYHCEAEIVGTLDDLIPMMEGFIKFLSQTLLSMPNIINLLSANPQRTKTFLENIVSTEKFTEIEFSKAVQLLKDNDCGDLINTTAHGSDISSQGEQKLLYILKADKPVWMRNFDRDRVAFYQKPHQSNKDKVINADLLFPSLTGSSFWGEIIGSGQRQDTYDEMLDSLKRQGINPEAYQWYMKLRNLESYRTTSGFGLGVERFIAWALGRNDIKDVILYPRLKNLATYP